MRLETNVPGLLVIMALTALGQEPSFQDIPDAVVKKVDPSVVAIQHERAGGSGFIVTADGYIISNGHVVRGDDQENPTEPAKSITVILNDERKFPAEVIGFCMNPDVSVLKIDCPDPLVPVVFGDSQNAHIGQKVFAVGMPHGLKRTFSSGILSNVSRTDLGTFTKVIQTDAAINPGNSGGPLFDRNGKVLGVNTYGTRGANNLGFTIPIHVVEALYHDIREHGRFIRADVPIFFVSELYDDLQVALGVEKGVLVDYVMIDTPAWDAGLRAGDVIIAQDGNPVSARTEAELSDLTWSFTIMEPGTPVTWTVLRADANGRYQQQTIQAVIEEAEPMIDTGRFPGEIKTDKIDALGLSFMQIARLHRVFHQLQDNPGVLVVGAENGSPAGKSELRKHDIITSVEGTAVDGVASFKKALEASLAARTASIELVVQREQIEWRTALAPYYDLGGQRVLVVVPPGKPRNLELVLRELIAQGADVTLASPDGDVAEAKARPVQQIALADVQADAVDILLLLDGEQASLYWDDATVVPLIKELFQNEIKLAAIGAATITLIAAEPELLERKMTTAKSYSGEAMQRNAQYTGSDVEKDEGILTTTGEDRQVLREFLKQLASGH